LSALYPLSLPNTAKFSAAMGRWEGLRDRLLWSASLIGAHTTCTKAWSANTAAVEPNRQTTWSAVGHHEEDAVCSSGTSNPCHSTGNLTLSKWTTHYRSQAIDKAPKTRFLAKARLIMHHAS
jgi:hypothetical protein